ncbi:unnamed protein product [Didymodactylos carnosus]|uniref:G-protein coupled receptors family 1 profile domain-containing protein n=1 Tax=Didymodactylos carnosus TaxID=1234261 RepID=A0A814BC40_9BILA|nr:unnamed protein product [Didymodactylos carnosus]CAF0926113.1 unnamed protein product [Didymodactylos carnosus]CAF3581493.1 unnamed protein product [Didymodactylos carnosus]CAF3704699.1 unnamed protein product [Didymodactylos carnosus]
MADSPLNSVRADFSSLKQVDDLLNDSKIYISQMKYDVRPYCQSARVNKLSIAPLPPDRGSYAAAVMLPQQSTTADNHHIEFILSSFTAKMEQTLHDFEFHMTTLICELEKKIDESATRMIELENTVPPYMQLMSNTGYANTRHVPTKNDLTRFINNIGGVLDRRQRQRTSSDIFAITTTVIPFNSTYSLSSNSKHQSQHSGISDSEQASIDAFNTYIQIGVGSLLFIFGLTFNCLSLLYFYVSRSFRHTTFRLYFSIISILDTLRLLEFLVFLLFDKQIIKLTLALCRFIFFFIMFTGQAGIFLTVALAVEKCIIIWFPIKGRLVFTMTISKIVLVLVLLLVFFADLIYLLPNFFLETYENFSLHTYMCVWQTASTSQQNKTNDVWKKHYFTFNTIFFHSIIPSISLLIINWLILYSLSKHRFVLSGSIDARHVLKREKQFKEKTIQLVLSSFFIIITISPRYVLTMVNIFYLTLTKTSLFPLHIYVNLNTVFRVLEMSNYSLNMIFSILSGRTSRREIRKLLWENFLWRFHFSKPNQTKNSQSFYIDDDEDTERSNHSAITMPTNLNRLIDTDGIISQQHEKPVQHHQLRTFQLNCCGLCMIDTSSLKQIKQQRFRSTNLTMRGRDHNGSNLLSQKQPKRTHSTTSIPYNGGETIYYSWNNSNDSSFKQKAANIKHENKSQQTSTTNDHLLSPDRPRGETVYCFRNIDQYDLAKKRYHYPSNIIYTHALQSSDIKCPSITVKNSSSKLKKYHSFSTSSSSSSTSSGAPTIRSPIPITLSYSSLTFCGSNKPLQNVYEEQRSIKRDDSGRSTEEQQQ